MSRPTPSIEEMFFAAMERRSSVARAAYLDEVCASDPDLRRRVERLLDAQPKVGSFLDSPAAGETLNLPPPQAMECPGTVIGPYKLLEPIGEGGMGVVYMAEQTKHVRRKVALKIIKPGMDTRQVIARFEAERQALALMDHPNIAKVLDAGTTESGRPYFVMELVKGIPITDYCDQHGLPIRERLDLFMEVCHAVQHAHQKGVIHRDIKPTNVLVTTLDGVPLPRVIDFGIAKATGQSLTDKTLFTGFAQLIGTPLYMSPEQAELSAVDIDTRSDIYSLGVLLYELLTGTTPFNQDTFRTAALDELRRIIREDEPPKPSTRLSTLEATATTISANRKSDPRSLGKLMRGELDWIVMKALEKNRNRRYETPSGLAADVRRYLDDEPVEAGPPSAWYRFRKLARRNRAALMPAAFVGLALVAGTAVSTWQAVRATRAEQRAQAARSRAQDAERTARAEADKAKAVNDFLTKDLLTQAEPANNAIEDKVTLLEVVDRAADKVGSRFHDQPEAESALRMTLADTYHSLGAFAKAKPQARAALDVERRLHGPEAPGTFNALSLLAHVRSHLEWSSEALELLQQASEGLQRTLGPDHADTLSSRNNLALAYQAAGRIAEAIRMKEEILKLHELKLGPDHHDTLISRNNLALAYQAAGRTAEAIALLEATSKLSESKLGPDHPDTLVSRHNLATAYLAAGRKAEAISLHEATLKLMTARLGPDHPHTLTGRRRLALAYQAAGRIAEAIALLEATSKLSESKLGPDHPDTLTSRHCLAVAYQAAGRTAEAIALHEATLKLRESKLGPDHPNTLTSRNNLAECYRAAGRTAEVIALTEATLKLRESTLGPDHSDTFAIRNNLAESYRAAGRTAEAMRLHEATIKLQEARLGPDHPDTLTSRNNLAAAYRAVGRTAEAIVLWEAVLLTAARKFGPAHPNTLATTYSLALALESLGCWAEAERLYRDVLTHRRKVEKTDSPVLAGVLAQIGNNLLKQAKWSEAEPMLRECLAIRDKVVPNDWSRFNTMNELGGALLGRGRYAEAEPLLLSGYDGMKARAAKIPPAAKPRVPEAAARIVRLYDAWGKPEKAAAWKRRLGLTDLPADVFARP